MLRSLLRLSAAVAFAALLMPGTPSAAPPPGLAYDEIVRIVANATPPPPGNFQNDVAALNAQQTAAAATPTPAPRKRMGFGNIIGAIAGGGNVAGAAGGAVAQNAADNAVQSSLGARFGAMGAGFANFLTPHLMRYAYWNGWERVDDVTAQTATIRKCDAGQVIHLNLAAKTYTIYAPNSEPAPAAPRGAPGPRGPAQAEQPGTAVSTFSNTTTSLAPLRIEGQPTSGYDTTTSFSTTQATGSCHNGSAGMQTVQYISPLTRPSVNSCPVRPPEGLPETAGPPPPTGGCKPTFSMHTSGPTPPTNRLALYSLVTFGAANGSTPPPSGASSFAFLTERGNIKTLGAADAGIFDVPQGFTKTP
jgi:hypothetical protein